MSATIRPKEVSDSENERKGLISLSAQAREIGRGTVSRNASIVHQRKTMDAAPNLLGLRRAETPALPLKTERNRVQAGDSQVARGKMKSSKTQVPMTNRMSRSREQAQQPLSVNYIQATSSTSKSMPTLTRKPEQVVSASSIVGSFELRTPFVQTQSQRGESPSRNSGQAGQWVENDKQAASTRANRTNRRQAPQPYSIPSTSAVPTIRTTMRTLQTISATRNILPQSRGTCCRHYRKIQRLLLANNRLRPITRWRTLRRLLPERDIGNKHQALTPMRQQVQNRPARRH